MAQFESNEGEDQHFRKHVIGSIRPTGSSLHQNVSTVNIFTPPSTSSSEMLRITGFQKDLSEVHNRKLVLEIVDNIFDERSGQFEASSSRCSSEQKRSSEHSFDRRLKYWKNMVQERKQIAAYIKERTGRHKQEVLFNRADIEERDKQTVKRLMDYAERMNPIRLVSKPEARLQEYHDTETCQHVNELRETWPQAEREGNKIVEISGLPNVAKVEMLGEGPAAAVAKEVNQKWQWLKSKVLEKRIEERRKDLERIIEYYPDIEHLEIVGESMTKKQRLKRDADIAFLYEEFHRDISSDTSKCLDECITSDKTTHDEPVDYGVRINEQVFTLLSKRSSRNVEIEMRFECEPFQWVTRRLMQLENIGRKVLNCEWVHRSFYDKTTELLKATDQEFLFDRRPFRLTAGEVRNIIVQYQPRKVQIVKEKWLLRINPFFFCRRHDSVIMLLNGRCRPSSSYVEKLNEIQRMVIEKSNLKMMRKLTTGLAGIMPLIEPHEAICPYTRVLTERELFEVYNEGYRCERFHDLELLRDIYKRVKKPREHAWDLRLDSLKALIMRVEGADKRALFFAEMMGVLEEMKGVPTELAEKVGDFSERDHSRLLYVRGIVATSIDEWEELTLLIEEAFYKPALDEFYAELMAEEEDYSTLYDDNQSMKIPSMDEEVLRRKVLKRMRRGKALRDSLYMQTYTHLCNVVENIVSVIESTQVV